MPVQIDMEMPQNCYECPLMVWCDQCEGYSNRCAYDQEIDCGFVIKAYKGNIVKEDHSNGTLWSRPERCPLREVDDRVEELEKKLRDVGSSPFDEQLGRK